MKSGDIHITADHSLLEKTGWKEFVMRHPGANFFQLPETYHLFRNVPAYKPYVIAAVDVNENRIKGLLAGVVQSEAAIYGKLTSRSIVWGGPLVENNNVEIAGLILEFYNRHIGPQAIYSQFRNIHDCSSLIPAFEKHGFRYLDHLNYIVHTKGENAEQLLAAMSKSKSRQIKKALQTATLAEAQSEDEVVEFYKLLQTLYREKVKKPLPPWAFFLAFYREIVKAGLGKYLLVKLDGKIIGGIMCPLLPDKTIYEWYIAGLDKEYKDQYPSIVATWAAIIEGQKAGLDHFDFLGAGKPDADYGVREFKAKFGGQLVSFGRFERVHKPLMMKIGTTGLSLYKKLKR